MSIVFSHNTASWILSENRHLSQSIRCMPPTEKTFSKTDFRNLQAKLNMEGKTVHLLTEDRNYAKKIPQTCQAHFCGKTSNLAAFLHFENAYVVSPELLFVQMSAVYSLVDSILFGMCLCGDYRPSEERFQTGEIPLTSADKITAFIEDAPSIKGLGNARIAASFLIDGSNSPQESRLATALSLPLRYGGFGLEKPALNMTIPGTSRKGDLCWPKQKLILEYDSNLHHDSAEKRNRDSMRSVQIELNGFRVISVRPEQVYDYKAYLQLCELVSKTLGAPLKAKSKSYREKQRELWQALYGSTGSKAFS